MYEPIQGDGANTTRHVIPFEFHITLQDPRKDRNIIARNRQGRSVASRVPVI